MEQIRPNGAIKLEGILQHLPDKDLSEQRMKISRAVFLVKRHEKTKKLGLGVSIWKMNKKTNFTSHPPLSPPYSPQFYHSFNYYLMSHEPFF